MRILRMMLFVGVAVLLLACEKDYSAVPGELARMPPLWPVRGLWLPMQATAHVLAEKVNVELDDERIVRRDVFPAVAGNTTRWPGRGAETGTWTVGFYTDLTWDEVVAHVDRCLSQQPYEVTETKPPRGNQQYDQGLRTYISDDRKTTISLKYLLIGGDEGTDIGYELSATVLPMELPERKGTMTLQ